MKFKLIATNVVLPLAILLLASSAFGAERYTTLSATTEFYRLTQEQQTQAGMDAHMVLAVVLTPTQGWYAYAPAPDNPLIRPPKLELMHQGTLLPNYLPAGTLKPDPFDPEKMVDAYPGPTPLFVPLPEDLFGTTQAATLTAVMCAADKCVLPNLDLSIPIPADPTTLPSVAQSPWSLQWHEAVGAHPIEAVDETPKVSPKSFTPRSFSPSLEVSGLVSAILLGLVAGLILNVMPCVLPVVSLKLSAFLSGATEHDEAERLRRFREHNLFFALGILLWFVFLAVLLGAGGMAWGELFQSAWVVGALALVLVTLAASLFGLFHLPVVDLKFDQAVKHPRLKALSTGLLATLLATPCSGPFLGGVLGWALLRPGSEIMVVFLAVGLGMASPYFVFMALPGLARFFPKPGPWLAQVERGVALFLLASAVYLVSILPDVGALPWLASAWCLATAWWLWRLTRSGKRQMAFRGLALALAIAGPAWLFTPQERIDPWTDFTPALFEQKLGQELMAVDFTADWCPTCRLLEATVLTDKKIRQWTLSTGATFIRVDLSDDNPAGEELLKSLGSQSIPLMAIFPAGEEAASPIIIRDLFTASQLEAALTAAGKR